MSSNQHFPTIYYTFFWSIFGKNIYNKSMENKKIKTISTCALIMALAYIGFQFLRIDIPVGTERTAVHLGNAFVILGAILEGPLGGLAGALGLTLADLTSGYVTSAPKTFILKLVMGLIASAVAKKVREKSPDKPFKLALLSSAIPLGINVFLDPLFGYFYKAYIFGIPQDMAATLSKIGSATTLVNAITSCVIVVVLWPTLRSALIKAGYASKNTL